MGLLADEKEIKIEVQKKMNTKLSYAMGFTLSTIAMVLLDEYWASWERIGYR